MYSMLISEFVEFFYMFTAKFREVKYNLFCGLLKNCLLAMLYDLVGT